MIMVAIVGMAGAGKTEVARLFEQNGFTRIRFGDITDEEVRKRGLELNEENERYVRELLRREQGMEAYAVWASPRTRHARLTGRRERGLTQEEAVSRDKEEIENINKGGPIAMADFTILNESSLDDLKNETMKIISRLGK